MAPNAVGHHGICCGSGSRHARNGRSTACRLRESLARISPDYPCRWNENYDFYCGTRAFRSAGVSPAFCSVSKVLQTTGWTPALQNRGEDFRSIALLLEGEPFVRNAV